MKLSRAKMSLLVDMPSGGGQDVTPWYLSGDVDPSNVIAAYQAKGAADYDTSKINLANPGTHNLTDVSAPTWNTSDGWIFDGTQALNTGLRSAQLGRGKTCSFIVRYSAIPADDAGHAILGGQYENSSGSDIPTISAEIYLASEFPPTRGVLISFDEGVGNWNAPEALGNAAGVVCLAGTKQYYNASMIEDHGNNVFSWDVSVDISPVYIGALNYEFEEEPGVYSPYSWLIGKVQAVAFYSSILTVEQVTAITAAIQAL